MANEGGWRVGLILGAEVLRVEAANAQLKTQEEPRPRTTQLHVTTQASRLPPTVRSRTIHLRFAPEPEAALRAQLRTQGLSEENAWLAAALGGGSLSSAQAWAEESLAEAREMVALLERAPRLSTSELLDFAEAFRGRDEVTRARIELLFQVPASSCCFRCTARSRGGPSRRRWRRTRARSSSTGSSAPTPASAPGASGRAAT